jgi:hypothetical protein
VLPIILSLLCFSCNDAKQNSQQAQQTEKITASSLINQSIEAAGLHRLANSDIAFTFRDVRYSASRSNGQFSLLRRFKKGNELVVDSLTNDGFTRHLNAELVHVPDSMVAKYAASVNSVHYFSVLPYGLNDPAVKHTILDEVFIKNKSYHTVQVTFDQVGGGEDFEDVFVYWINKASKTVDYLAYSYEESDGRGIRFREAYNTRTIKGVQFVDYNNYKPRTTFKTLTNLPVLFENERLELVSKIELDSIAVVLN